MSWQRDGTVCDLVVKHLTSMSSLLARLGRVPRFSSSRCSSSSQSWSSRRWPTARTMSPTGSTLHGALRWRAPLACMGEPY